MCNAFFYIIRSKQKLLTIVYDYDTINCKKNKHPLYKKEKSK